VGEGEVNHEVGEVYLNEELTARDVIAKIDERGFNFTDPLTALNYALKLPARQTIYPLVVIFKVNGQTWSLILDGGGSHRIAGVCRYDLDAYCSSRCRFLVVNKSFK
jgi:hypothetical protein